MDKGKKKILELRTPDLGDSDKIELVKWYVAEKSKVEIGDEILELVTDKASFPVESPTRGILIEILVKEGELVVKNQILGKLELEESSE